MKILLADVDSKIPNLALMKISSHHKELGDEVGFDVSNPDKIYASVVFTKNAWKARALKFMYPDTEIEMGGSGIDLSKTLSSELEYLKPDYDLYPSEYSMGFTTRGCIRKCPFCIVPEKEGKIKRWQHISEFHDSRFDKVVCLDNNITADQAWFFENTDYVLENNLKFNAIQGLDIRILTPETAERIHELRWDGQIHFAWDNMVDEVAVRTGISILKQAGIKTRHNVTFYVLVGFNTTEDEDKYRCRTLKKLNCNPFVIQYAKNKWTRKIAWWANRKQAFWAFDIDELDRGGGA